MNSENIGTKEVYEYIKNVLSQYAKVCNLYYVDVKSNFIAQIVFNTGMELNIVTFKEGNKYIYNVNGTEYNRTVLMEKFERLKERLEKSSSLKTYILENIVTGKRLEISEKNLKNAIESNFIEVTNLTISKNGNNIVSTDERLSEGNGQHIDLFKNHHVVGVAEYMRERAPDYKLDPDLMYAVGILHDIGYLIDWRNHEKYGADILDKMGVKYDVMLAVKNHGGNIRTIEKEDKYAITPILILLIEADLSVNAMGYRVGFKGRLDDIKSRYGDNSPAAINVADNTNYIEGYWKKHGIKDQSFMIRDNRFKVIEIKK